MKKVLMLSHVASMIDQFCMPNIKLLLDMGCEVHVASNFERGYTCTRERVESLKAKLDEAGVKWHQIDFERNPMKVGGLIKAYGQLKKLFVAEGFTFAHSHGPVGGILCRMACAKYNVKAMHTAHGFHFYTGCPKSRWLLYYPVEKHFAKSTDILVTINAEDHERAKSRFKAKETVYSPGIGVDLEAFGKKTDETGASVRAKIGVPDDKKWILNVGELIPRKNQAALIEAAAGMPDVFLTIAGTGPLHDELESLIQRLGAADRIKLLGFREDVARLVGAADCFAFPSFQEGLSVAVMEAMAAGRPIALSRIRGNVDLVNDGEGGFFFDPADVRSIERALKNVLDADMEAMGGINAENVKKFGINEVLPLYREWYASLLSQ